MVSFPAAWVFIAEGVQVGGIATDVELPVSADESGAEDAAGDEDPADEDPADKDPADEAAADDAAADGEAGALTAAPVPVGELAAGVLAGAALVAGGDPAPPAAGVLDAQAVNVSSAAVLAASRMMGRRGAMKAPREAGRRSPTVRKAY